MSLFPLIDVHIRERFAASSVEVDPCVHLIVENVLPTEFYCQIEADIPDEKLWIAAYKHNLETLPEDLSCPMFDCRDPNRSSASMIDAALIWQEKYIDIIGFITGQIREKLRPQIDSYMAQLIAAGVYNEPQALMSPINEFCYRPAGWNIKPHAHDLIQAVQWMLYFPLPDSTEQQGTTFYRLKSPLRIEGGKIHDNGSIWFDDVSYSFMVPYRRNTLVVFLNTPHTAHGSLELSDMVARRYFFVSDWWQGKPNPVDLLVTPEGNLTRMT